MIKKILMDILTTMDGVTFDNGRVLGALAVISFIIFSGYHVFSTHNFEYQAFGIGIGTTFAGIGVNLKLKENTEPKQNV